MSDVNFLCLWLRRIRGFDDDAAIQSRNKNHLQSLPKVRLSDDPSRRWVCRMFLTSVQQSVVPSVREALNYVLNTNAMLLPQLLPDTITDVGSHREFFRQS